MANITITANKKVKLSLCLTKHYTKKAYGGCGCIDPRFIDYGTSRRRVVSFTILPLYPGVATRSGFNDMKK
jgi:hypothetical protein